MYNIISLIIRDILENVKGVLVGTREEDQNSVFEEMIHCEFFNKLFKKT